jgi:hypothetical protein
MKNSESSWCFIIGTQLITIQYNLIKAPLCAQKLPIQNMEDNFIEFNSDSCLAQPLQPLGQSSNLPLTPRKRYENLWNKLLRQTKFSSCYLENFLKRHYVPFSFKLIKLLKSAFHSIGKNVEIIEQFWNQLKLSALILFHTQEESVEMQSFCQKIVAIDPTVTFSQNLVNSCANKFLRFEFDIFAGFNRIGSYFNFSGAKEIEFSNLNRYLNPKTQAD